MNGGTNDVIGSTAAEIDHRRVDIGIRGVWNLPEQ